MSRNKIFIRPFGMLLYLGFQISNHLSYGFTVKISYETDSSVSDNGDEFNSDASVETTAVEQTSGH